MTDDGVVEVSVHIAASPETVFPYFTDPSRYVQWMGSGAILEPVPGGPTGSQMRGGVEAAVLHRDQPAAPARVHLGLDARSPPSRPAPRASSSRCGPEHGGTRVVLRHHGLPDDDQGRAPPQGRAGALPRPAGCSGLRGGDPGPDPNT